MTADEEHPDGGRSPRSVLGAGVALVGILSARRTDAPPWGRPVATAAATLLLAVTGPVLALGAMTS